MAGFDPAISSLDDLCARCASSAAVDSVGLQLMANVHAGAIAASDATASTLEDLQFVLGEGPSVDVVTTDAEALVDDLARAHARWPRFVPEALAAGIRATLAYPLRVDHRAGSLTFYVAGSHAGAPDHARLRSHAIAVTSILLGLPTDADGLASAIRRAASNRDLLYQAAGIVSVMLDCSIEDALARLRAHAFRTGEGLYDTARSVVAHGLRFD